MTAEEKCKILIDAHELT